MANKRHAKPIVWAVIQLCGINRWTFIVPIPPLCMLYFVFLYFFDQSDHWMFLPIMGILILPLIMSSLQLAFAVLFASFSLLRCAVLSHNAEVVPILSELINDTLQKRERTTGYWKRQKLAFTFMREIACTYGAWTVIVTMLVLVMILGKVMYHYVGVYRDHIQRGALRLETEQPGYPYNLAQPKYGFGEPPEYNRLTLPDYTKARLMLQPHELEARRLLAKHASPMLLNQRIPTLLCPRYVTFRQNDVDHISGYLPADSPVSAFLRTLVTPPVERVPIPVEEVNWLYNVVPTEMEKLVRDIHSDRIKMIDAKGLCYMYYPWEAETIGLLQEHYREQEEELKKTSALPFFYQKSDPAHKQRSPVLKGEVH